VENLEIHLPRAVRTIHAPQAALAGKRPEKKYSDRVFLDERGNLGDRADNRDAAQPAALFVKFEVLPRRAVPVAHARPNAGDCPDDRQQVHRGDPNA
jgi:hypothetical protein